MKKSEDALASEDFFIYVRRGIYTIAILIHDKIQNSDAKCCVAFFIHNQTSIIVISI